MGCGTKGITRKTCPKCAKMEQGKVSEIQNGEEGEEQEPHNVNVVSSEESDSYEDDEWLMSEESIFPLEDQEVMGVSGNGRKVRQDERP